MVWISLLISIHTHTHLQKLLSCLLHIAILDQVPQEEGTFLTFSEWGKVGGVDGVGGGFWKETTGEPFFPAVHLIIWIHTATSRSTD